MSFLLTMTLHPDKFNSLQTELDNVVGAGRMPTFKDILSLLYTRACVKETLRWRPVTAGGVPQKLTRDDDYDGFFIAKGTNIHGNQWYPRAMVRAGISRVRGTINYCRLHYGKTQ
jgi:cytochrome P450